jgi:PPOX class probable F420-dependent enzyme
LSPLTWPAVARRLHASRSLWLTTTAPGGPPHAVPVWGAVHGEVLHLYTSRGTRKARNVAAEPRVAVHLPDPEDVLLVEGRLEDLGHPADVPDVVAAFAAKYTAADDRAYLPGVDVGVDVVYALRPRRALSWQLSDFENSQRRWEGTGPESRPAAAG